MTPDEGQGRAEALGQRFVWLIEAEGHWYWSGKSEESWVRDAWQAVWFQSRQAAEFSINANRLYAHCISYQRKVCAVEHGFINAASTAALRAERVQALEEAAGIAEDFDRQTWADIEEKYMVELDGLHPDLGLNIARVIRARAIREQARRAGEENTGG